MSERLDNSMVSALEWAVDYVERAKLFEAPLKSNGYPVDGWKPPTQLERLEIIKQVAYSVTPSSPVEVRDEDKVLCPHGGLLCYRCINDAIIEAVRTNVIEIPSSLNSRR